MERPWSLSPSTRQAAFSVKRGTLGTVRKNDRDQARREGKPELAMSRTDAAMLRRFGHIVSHAWVTPTGRDRFATIRLNLNGFAAALAVQEETIE
jgi:hypothetical protein